ncbi:MAG: tRNA threonylcarbamoyladenosine dehydratase [Bacteroidales bacterium]|nr:tRNA threonylcarbamoyladenosine dehydratase [Bacteroidales bacterium]
MEKQIFERTHLLLGDRGMEYLSTVNVILFGVGGVGSWCAESLVRSGVHHLTIVDMDKVDITNVNRQLMATTKTVGEIKVEVMKERLGSINPNASITSFCERYTSETRSMFNLSSYDYIIDAIDSVEDKVDLLVYAANETNATVFSSMGAALKVNPNLIKTAEFWKVHGCPLASSLRRRLKREEIQLEKEVLCVFSDEKIDSSEDIAYSILENKQRINGTLAHITAIFGLNLCGLLIQDVIKRTQYNKKL